ncbi:piggyBac transposable element-derived protein 4-like [Vespula maculifrons]|uniref:PiggyBac transposable element-derived protein 4-like n=1 Tax=Vespula maculifrons TaxID=7453 RepID=A0ABD2AGW2_VESMC
MEPYSIKGRTITTDNFFRSLPFVSKLLAKRITLILWLVFRHYFLDEMGLFSQFSQFETRSIVFWVMKRSNEKL